MGTLATLGAVSSRPPAELLGVNSMERVGFRQVHGTGCNSTTDTSFMSLKFPSLFGSALMGGAKANQAVSVLGNGRALGSLQHGDAVQLRRRRQLRLPDLAKGRVESRARDSLGGALPSRATRRDAARRLRRA